MLGKTRAITSIRRPSKPSHELDDGPPKASANSEAWEGVLLAAVLEALLRRELRPLEVVDQVPLKAASMAITAGRFHLITPHVRCSGNWRILFLRLKSALVEQYSVSPVPIREMNDHMCRARHVKMV